jgi:hypothetical protein
MHLSSEEFITITNTRFLQVKAEATVKVWNELEELQAMYKGIVKELGISFPTKLNHAKISKGENYKGLPYLVSDYPAIFNKDNILALRTMFWWGNFFSITLHLQGLYKEQYSATVIAYLKENKPNGLFLACNATPWEYHYESDNYCAVDTMDNDNIERLINQSNFIKLSAKLNLQDYGELKFFMEEWATLFLGLLKPNA